MTNKKRIHTLDETRGFCVFCMVFFHCFFTLGVMFGGKFSLVLFDVFTPIQPVFATAFILICGISCHLSHNNLSRGLKILVVSIAVTIVTTVIMPETPIVFGILHLLCVGIFLYIPIKPLIEKIPVWLGVGLCLLLFIITYNLPIGYLGFGNIKIDLPANLYSGDFMMFLGFASPYKAYSDYFPLLPWIFPFFAGTFIGKPAKKDKFPKFMYKSRIPFFSILGQNALLVYVVHQPIAYGVYYLISLLGGIPQ